MPQQTSQPDTSLPGDHCWWEGRLAMLSMVRAAPDGGTASIASTSTVSSRDFFASEKFNELVAQSVDDIFPFSWTVSTTARNREEKLP